MHASNTEDPSRLDSTQAQGRKKKKKIIEIARYNVCGEDETRRIYSFTHSHVRSLNTLPCLTGGDWSSTHVLYM